MGKVKRLRADRDQLRWSQDQDAVEDYLQAHRLLPDEARALAPDELVGISVRLSRDDLPAEERKRLLLVLAHDRSETARAALRLYVDNAHRGFERFARLAFREAAQWDRASRQGPTRDGHHHRCGRRLL